MLYWTARECHTLKASVDIVKEEIMDIIRTQQAGFPLNTLQGEVLQAVLAGIVPCHWNRLGLTPLPVS